MVAIEGNCNGVNFTTRYAHLHPDTIQVTVGQEVEFGQLIGYSFKSGTENYHLHYEFVSGAIKMGIPNIPQNVVPEGCCDYAAAHPEEYGPADYCHPGPIP
jgi:hypothetical protein